MNTQERGETTHTLSILVDNEPGVLSRVAGLFSGRGFNIASLSVAETMDPRISRITAVLPGNEMILEQIKKQLNKLINVHKVIDITDLPRVERELALLKVNAKNGDRPEVLRIVDIFRGKVVDVSPHDFTIEVTGDRDKIGAILALLSKFGISEIAKSGITALPRSKKGEK
ncbi:MAG: acetolactate synthase small subunit [Deltaproteobacteria bacterium]